MSIKRFKSKSFSDGHTDQEIETGSYVTRFVSFESLVQLVRQDLREMSITDRPIGYRVTEQGLELVYE